MQAMSLGVNILANVLDYSICCVSGSIGGGRSCAKKPTGWAS